LENKRNNLKVASETALLVHVELPGSSLDAVQSLAELESLAEAAGAIVLGRVRQKRSKASHALYIGKGKAEEIAQKAEQYGANVVIFDNDLSPAQIRELEKIVHCKVLDRSELILDIFASRARTAEARMQVELAQLEYTYPRLARMWSHLDTVVGSGGAGAAAAVGGIGTRGPGESQLEIDRRLVNKRIAALRRQIEQVDERKKRQVQSRSKHFTVGLVGYTNAGKTTLMNTLTGTNAFVADQLFATLDTKTARWNLGGELYALLSDTVGFVRNLPHKLVASFRATLEEAIHADLLLHVVDVSHPQADSQIEAVNSVLAELHCDEKDILLIFNKIDVPGLASRCDTFTTLYPDAIALSARTGVGVDRLIETTIGRVTGEILHLRVVCSQANGRIRGYLHTHGTIIAEEYTDSQIIFEASLGRRQLPGLKNLKPLTCETIL
jgi:GTP-binding protein HflX